MGKNGRVGDVRQTVNEPGERSLVRGARVVIRDGAIEFSATDGAVADTVLRRTAAGTVGAANGAYTGTLAVTGAATLSSSLDVTGTLTAFGYLGVGGNAGITGGLDVAGNLSGGWFPRDAGLASWSIDPALASGTLQLTGGTIYLTKLPICRDVTPTKLYWYATTGSTTSTASQCWVAVLSSAGALLGSPVDVATASETSGLKTTTVAPGALSAGTFVWGAIVLAANTVATLAVSPASALPTLSNVGLAAAGLRHATNGTSQTTITTRTPASNSAGPALWMGLGT
jgi:hypothetical protein